MQFEDIILWSKELIENFIVKNNNWIIIIRWATATWKSKLSINLAKYFDIEIISSDSRQIFKEMNIWTDKVPQEILDKIPHHQINIIWPEESYTAWQRQTDVKKQIKEIQSKWKIPMIVWWTWLYIDTIYKNFQMPEIWPDVNFRKKMFNLEEKNPWFLHEELKQIDPDEAKKIHPKSTRYLVRALEIFHSSGKTKTESFLEKEVDQPILMIWIRREKDETNRLIIERINEMLKNWLIDEVKWLLDKWYSKNLQSMQWIWYKEVVWYIERQYDLDEMKNKLILNTQHLAKKQRSRFRRYINDEQHNPKKNVEYKVWYLD